MSKGARRFWAFIALGVAGGLLIVADATLYLDREILKADAFAERTADSLDEPEVRRVVAEEIGNQLGSQIAGAGVSPAAADQLLVRAVGTDKFRELFRQAAVEVHGAAFAENPGQVELVVRNLGPVLHRQVAAINPDLADFVPQNIDVTVASVSEQVNGAVGDVARFSDRSQLIARLTFVFGFLLLAGSILLHPERRIAIGRAGWLFIFIGLLFLALFEIGEAAALSYVDEPGIRDAAGDVWGAYFGDLRALNIGLAILGALITLGAALFPQIQGSRRPPPVGWDDRTRAY